MEKKAIGIVVHDTEANPVVISFDPGIYILNEDDLLNMRIHIAEQTKRTAVLDTDLGGDGILRLYINEAIEPQCSRNSLVNIVVQWLLFSGESLDKS